jgi:hypothetical protein
MYFYRIGYASFEDSDFYELVHKDKFSKEEFESFVFKATIRVLEGVITGKYKGEFCSALEGLSFERILEDVVKELVKVDGFENLKYQAEWSCFSWPSITEDKSWTRQRGAELERLTDAIPDELKEKINEMAREWTEREDY